MAYYVDQELFNTMVLGLALAQFVGEFNPEAQSASDKVMRQYLDFYVEDDFLPEAKDCAVRTLGWLRDIDPSSTQIIAALAALSDAARWYKPDGKRKPWRLFKGMWFASASQPVPNRSKQYFVDLGLYFINLQCGKIPT